MYVTFLFARLAADYQQTVEMWLHRSGYHPPNEPAATHCRRRYRLLPGKVQNPNLPAPDPSLLIVHYSRAAPTDHIPAARIPVLPQVQAMLSQRRFLQSQGQLARKDFMLHDRMNWPTINFPPQMAPHGFAQPQGAYPSAMVRPPYYPQPGQAIPGAPGPIPAKAPRGHRASSAAMSGATAEFALEDEDVSGGDLMDLLTPREVSKMRYQQHHEWMEEIFASPYAISQITPVSLGLGRKGELESLTAGFFDAPVVPSTNQKDTDSSQPTKMEPVKAEEFASRVARRVADMSAEIEKLKKRHARRMEKFNRSSLLKDAELRLRDSATNPTDTGSEIWRLEGRVEVPAEGESPQAEPVVHQAKYKVDDVVKELETTWRKQVVSEPKVSCVEKGGLLEKIEPERKEQNMEGDLNMDGSGLINQFQGQSAATPGGATGVSAAPQLPATEQPGMTDFDIDMDMGGDQNTGAGKAGDYAMNHQKKDGADTAGDTPASGLQGFTPGNTGSAGDTGLDGGNFDFTNIDTAGDALAAYTEQNDGLDLPDLENSAFGDAFHASDNEPTHHHEADEM